MKRDRQSVKQVMWALAAMLALPAVVAATPQRAAKPLVQVIDGTGLKQAIVRNRGKVVMVNLWATWCGPCVAEFPNLVKLYDTHRSRGLVVLAVAMDEPKTQPEVRPFLAAQKATFPAFLRKKGDPGQFVNTVDKNWGGAIPTTYVFDRNGTQVGMLVGGQSYTRLAAAVEPLLK